jgi:hypothetical protein
MASTKTTPVTRTTNTLSQALSESNLNPTRDDNWESRVLIIGGIIGLLGGLLSAYLLNRTSREVRGGPPHISSSDALKLSITAIGFVRAIVGLGDHR